MTTKNRQKSNAKKNPGHTLSRKPDRIHGNKRIQSKENMVGTMHLSMSKTESVNIQQH